VHHVVRTSGLHGGFLLQYLRSPFSTVQVPTHSDFASRYFTHSAPCESCLARNIGLAYTTRLKWSEAANGASWSRLSTRNNMVETTSRIQSPRPEGPLIALVKGNIYPHNLERYLCMRYGVSRTQSRYGCNLVPVSNTP
jgi:hypothetical protein